MKGFFGTVFLDGLDGLDGKRVERFFGRVLWGMGNGECGWGWGGGRIGLNRGIELCDVCLTMPF